jgi:GT2 family glycosyltransferase/2-polyprenyl-3-methyl-5-hydroxy-6-metoxy-1,4-benzoquinol methylase/glycosyltransferase involved in cell wall biosynthesis
MPCSATERSQSSKEILDVGCGAGAKIPRLLERGKVTGIDISDEAIGTARRLYPDATFIKMDAETLDFPDSHFDEIHCYDVLEHVDRLDIVLENLHRVLKEGGLLYVEVPNVRAEEFLVEFDKKFMDRSGHKNRLSLEEWIAHLNKHRFEIRSIRGTRFYDLLYYMCAILTGQQLLNDRGELSEPTRAAYVAALNRTLMLLARLSATPRAELASEETKLLEEALGMPIQDIVLLVRLCDDVGSRALPYAYLLGCLRSERVFRQNAGQFLKPAADGGRLGRVFRDVLAKRLDEQAEEIRSQHATYADREKYYTSQLLERDTRIVSLERQVRTLQREIEAIRRSSIFRVLRFVARNVDRAFPDGTNRGSLKRTVVMSLDVIAEEGIASFLRRARDKVRSEMHQPALVPVPLAESQYVEWLEANEIDGPSTSGELLRLSYDLIVFPIIGWDFRFQRPQQICIQFANNGHRIFYLKTTFEMLRGRDSASPQIRPIRGNVNEVRLVSASDVNIETDCIRDKNLMVLAQSMDELTRTYGIISALCLVESPAWTPLVELLKSKYGWRIVYDCLDRYRSFSTLGNAVISQEEKLSRMSDLVLASSLPIYDEQKALNPSAVLVRNAADFEHFAKVAERDPQIQSLFERLRIGNRKIVGYYGAIADWFDVCLVKRCATLRPEWQFVLIGSTMLSDTRPLAGLENVHLLGEQPYRKLPQYLEGFDVCIIPFLRGPLTEATNPTKIYEYLSAGKPTVSVSLPETRALSDLLYTAEGENDFVQKIEQAMEEDSPSLREERVAFARQNTWQTRFKIINEAIRDLYPKVTIVVVTYNNIELLRLCLRSIFGYTDYPNYEVILVDNASKDGTAEWVAQFQRDCPDLKVSLQEENVGFCPAVNRGIEISSGEYVAVLNDDVLVTRGWLARLVQHLQHDPSIGLICTSTDFAGNEALYPTSFSRIARLQEFAFKFYRGNFGTLFPLRTVPMFCVLAPRKMISEIGSLDEGFEVGMFEDDDYSYRARLAGYRTLCAGDVFVHHAGKASFKKLSQEQYSRLFEQNRGRFEGKWEMSWLPYGDSRRRDEIILRARELERIMSQREERHERTAVLFPTPDQTDFTASRRSALAGAFVRQGFMVFLIGDTDETTSGRGFRPAGMNTYVFNGPLEVLEQIDRPVVVTSAQGVQNLVFFRNPIVVYECLDDPQAYETNETIVRHHNCMLERAAVVLVGTEFQLSKVTEKRRGAVLCSVESDFEKLIRDHLVTRGDIPS